VSFCFEYSHDVVIIEREKIKTRRTKVNNMGFDNELIDFLRERYPHCFREQKRLPKGVKLRVVSTDVMQLVYRIPEYVRNQRQVYIHIVKYLRNAAMEAVNSLDPVLDAGDTVQVYGVFDSSDTVTAAKGMCQLDRYKHSRPAPAGIEAEVQRFEDGEDIGCKWADFVSFGPGRKALLKYLSETLAGAPASLLGDGMVLHASDAGPLGEGELYQQWLAARDAKLGVMSDSSDSDLLIALLLMMRGFGKDGQPLPNIVIRCTKYRKPDEAGGKKKRGKGRTTKAKRDHTVEVVNEDEDCDLLGPPPQLSSTGEEDPAGVRAAIGELLKDDNPVGSSTAVSATKPTMAWAASTKAVEHAPAAVDTAAEAPVTEPPDKPKRVAVREYTLVNDLWKAIRADGPHIAEAFAFLALTMGSDLVPGTIGGGSPFPGVGALFVWKTYMEVSAFLGGDLVKQAPLSEAFVEDAETEEEGEDGDEPTPSDADTEPDETPPPTPSASASTSTSVGQLATNEVGTVEKLYDYRVSWKAFIFLYRCVYSKKLASKLTFRVAKKHGRDYAIIPTWQELVETSDRPAGLSLRRKKKGEEGEEAAAAPIVARRGLRVLDLQYCRLLGALGWFALNYYCQGTLTRDPYAKDDEGKSLCGWQELLGQTLTTLAAENYDPFSRWPPKGMPPTSQLFVAGADTAYGYGVEEFLIPMDRAPGWLIKKCKVSKIKRARPDADDDETPKKKRKGKEKEEEDDGEDI
jgi:hypothetical protein